MVVSFRGLGLDIPLAGALAVGPWAGVPDTLVRHDCGSYVNDGTGSCLLAGGGVGGRLVECRRYEA